MCEFLSKGSRCSTMSGVFPMWNLCEILVMLHFHCGEQQHRYCKLLYKIRFFSKCLGTRPLVFTWKTKQTKKIPCRGRSLIALGLHWAAKCGLSTAATSERFLKRLLSTKITLMHLNYNRLEYAENSRSPMTVLQCLPEFPNVGNMNMDSDITGHFLGSILNFILLPI